MPVNDSPLTRTCLACDVVQKFRTKLLKWTPCACPDPLKKKKEFNWSDRRRISAYPHEPKIFFNRNKSMI